MPESQELKDVLALLQNKKGKLAAMLAPSFPIDFQVPQIINKLKRAGFDYVVEVARGAVETNKHALAELPTMPDGRMITSPCPSSMGLLQTKFPQLVKYMSKSDSPMVATARIVLNTFTDTRPVFIGPCLLKCVEAKRYPDLHIIAITYKELAQVFDTLNVKDKKSDFKDAHFDIEETSITRLYPISGGLTQSSNAHAILTKEQYRCVSGPVPKVIEGLQEFERNPEIKLLDILFCPGGCVSGPGIISKDPLHERQKRVLKHWSQTLD